MAILDQGVVNAIARNFIFWGLALFLVGLASLNRVVTSVWYTGFRASNPRKLALYALLAYTTASGVLQMSHGIEIASFYNTMPNNLADFLLAWLPLRWLLLASLVATVYQWSELFPDIIPMMEADSRYTRLAVVEDDFADEEAATEQDALEAQDNRLTNHRKVYFFGMSLGAALATHLLVLFFALVREGPAVASLGAVLEAIQSAGMALLFGRLSLALMHHFVRAARNTHGNDMQPVHVAQSIRLDFAMDEQESATVSSALVNALLFAFVSLCHAIYFIVLSSLPHVAPDSYGFLFFLDVASCTALLLHHWVQPSESPFGLDNPYADAASSSSSSHKPTSLYENLSEDS